MSVQRELDRSRRLARNHDEPTKNRLQVKRSAEQRIRNSRKAFEEKLLGISRLIMSDALMKIGKTILELDPDVVQFVEPVDEAKSRIIADMVIEGIKEAERLSRESRESLGDEASPPGPNRRV